jgi:hypothetical protein
LTIEEQRQLFLSKTPTEFMEFWADQKDKGLKALPICRFIALKCCKEIGRELTKDEIEFQKKYNKNFSDLDISGFIPSRYWAQLNPSIGRALTKNIISGVRTNIIQSNLQNGKNVSGIAELLKEICQNLEFAKNDISTKGLTYNEDKLHELLNGIFTFSGKSYDLQDKIRIKLSPSTFTHILIGHVPGYKIPRKGGQVLFEKVHNWQDLLKLIDQIIKSIEPDIIEHFSNKKGGFDKTNILLDGIEFGIHIGQYGDIKTFYEKRKY